MTDNERAQEYANGNEEFAEWLDELDKLVSDRITVGLFDLEDMCLWDEWEAGSSPEDTMRELVAPTVDQNYGVEYGDLLRS